MAPSPRLNRQAGSASRFLLAFALSLPLVLTAQELPIPVHTHYAMLLKTLTFDHNLRARCGDTVVIGVVYQSKYPPSASVKNQVVSAGRDIATSHVDELPVRMIPIDLSGKNDLATQISIERINTLYVTPLRAVDMKAITSVTRKANVLTLTGVSAYVESGLSIGVGLREGRPSLLINRRASRAEGADLGSQLLELARIIR